MTKIFKNAAGENEVLSSYDKLLTTWNVPVEERDIEGKYGVTHVITAGDRDRPPLLLFHGVGDNSALMWSFNAAALAGQFRLIAVDTLGAPGKSRPGPGYGTGFSIADWQGELLDSLALKRVYAAGVSYGCYMAQSLIVHFPERVARAVGMSGAVFGQGAQAASTRRMVPMMLNALLHPFRGRQRLLRLLIGPRYEEILKDPEYLRHWELLRKHYRTMAQRFHKRVEFSNEEAALFRGRMLFLIGREDALFYGQALESYARYGVTYKVIEDAGHSLNAQFPALVDGEIIGFLLD